MASLNISGFAAALKTMYPYSVIEKLTLLNHPFFAMLKKNENFGGENLVIPVHYEDIAGRSTTFSVARANKAGSLKAKFILTRVKDYAIASIENEVIEASKKGDAAALQKALESETDSAFDVAGRSLASQVYRAGTGSRSTIHALTALGTTTMRFANAGDAVHFAKGQSIVFSAADGGALRTAVTLDIDSINRDAGTCVLSATPNSLGAGIALADYIYVEGDAANGATNIQIAGLAKWIPATAPTAGDNHFGVDRSVDDVRLAGIRFDGSGYNIREALEAAADRIDQEGGRPTHCFLVNSQYTKLKRLLGSSVEFDSVTAWGNAKISFKAITLATNKGEVRILSDPMCDNSYGWMLNMDTWTLHGLNKAPHIQGMTESGGEPFLLESEDARELRVVSYANLGCTKPNHNARITLP